MPVFRIATWNCADGLDRKLPLFHRIDADLIVVSEVRAAAFAALAPGFAGAFYSPSSSARGIASFCRHPGLVQHRFTAPDGGECYQRLTYCGIDILAAWVKPQGGYTAPATRAITRFLRRPRAKQRILLGDLNLNPGFDRIKATGRATALMAQLGRAGMRSLYHQHMVEEFGHESRATHYFLRDQARPFHIDYIFASHGLTMTSFDLGNPSDWIGRGLGDHVPLLAELRRLA